MNDETTTRASRRAATTITEEAAADAATRITADEVLQQDRDSAATSFAERLRQGACVVRLTLEKAGRHRKLATTEYTVASDVQKKRQRTGATKRLFKHPAFEAITSIQGEARRFMRLHEVDQTVLGPGRHLVPLKFVPAIYEELTRLKREHDILVTAFVAQYDAILAGERAELGSLYRASDYPRAEAIESEFEMRWRFEEFNVAGVLREISPTIYEAERNKFVEEWEDDIATMRAALRVSFARVVGAMVERLTPEPGDPAPKTFKDTLVGNMMEFLTMFDAKNFAGDDALRALVERARTVLSGVDAQALRAKEGTREAVHVAMSAINDQLDRFVEVRQRRIVRVTPPPAASAGGA